MHGRSRPYNSILIRGVSIYQELGMQKYIYLGQQCITSGWLVMWLHNELIAKVTNFKNWISMATYLILVLGSHWPWKLQERECRWIGQSSQHQLTNYADLCLQLPGSNLNPGYYVSYTQLNNLWVEWEANRN